MQMCAVRNTLFAQYIYEVVSKKQVKLRGLRVQQTTLHGGGTKEDTGCTSQDGAKQESDNQPKNEEEAEGYCCVVYVKKSKITAHIYEYILVHVCIEKIWENVFV